jgi:hypothetical protein
MRTKVNVEQLAVGQFWKVRVGRKRYQVGKITKLKQNPHGFTISMIRVNEEDGDEFGAIDELHLLMVSPADLVKQLELDNFYGMLVPFGTKKKHRANGNVP